VAESFQAELVPAESSASEESVAATEPEVVESASEAEKTG